MTAPISRQNIDGSKADTANGVNVANFLLGTGNAWDCIQTLGVGVTSISSGTANLTQANAGMNLVDASAGNVIINLPACSAAVGALFQFKRIDATANTVTINRVGADTLDGSTSLSMASQYQLEEMRSDGVSAWRRLSSPSNSGQLAGLRNAVINGNGLVQQRAAPTLTAALQYGAADRHLIGVTSGTSVSGTVGVLSNSGFSCGVGYGAIAASWTTGQFVLKHRIEAANSKQFNGKTVTVSGKLYQDTGGSRNFTVSLGKPTTTADTFSAVTNLGTSSAIAVPSGTVTSFSYTLALGATDASLGLELLITDNAANTVANKNYTVSDLQVEIESVATVFEQRPIQMELALAMRYYEQAGTLGGVGPVAGIGRSNDGLALVGVMFKVTKRATPTISGLSTGVPGISPGNIDPSGFTVSATGGTNYSFASGFAASSEL